MYIIYYSIGQAITTVTAVEFWDSAVEIAEREAKYGCNDQVWIEDVNGKVYGMFHGDHRLMFH